MTRVDVRDLIAGGILTAIGIAVAIYTPFEYDLGTFAHMGVGMVPTMLGVLLAIFGGLVMVPAFFRSGHMPTFPVMPPLYVLLSTAAFAIGITWFGLASAVVASVVVATLAMRRIGFLSSLLLAAGLVMLTYGIFVVGLGMNIELFMWPF